MVTISNSINNQVGATNVGATNTLTVTNPDNTNSASNALVTVSVGGASAGDVQTKYTTTATIWSTGIDNSDSDSFKITNGATLGTGDFAVFGIAAGGSLTLNCAGILETAAVGAAGVGLITRNTDNTNTGSEASHSVEVGGTSAGDAFTDWNIGVAGATRSWSAGVHNQDVDNFKISTASGSASKPSTGTAVFVSTVNGEITMPLTPAFLAYANAIQSNVTGDGTTYTITFPAEVYDQNSDFDGTSTFTAPATGRYHFCVLTQVIQLAAGHTSCNWILNTSNRTYYLAVENPIATGVGDAWERTASAYADMDAGDTATVTIQISGATKVVDVYGAASTDPRTFFSGMLAC